MARLSWRTLPNGEGCRRRLRLLLEVLGRADTSHRAFKGGCRSAAAASLYPRWRAIFIRRRTASTELAHSHVQPFEGQLIMTAGFRLSRLAFHLCLLRRGLALDWVLTLRQADQGRSILFPSPDHPHQVSGVAPGLQERSYLPPGGPGSSRSDAPGSSENELAPASDAGGTSELPSRLCLNKGDLDLLPSRERAGGRNHSLPPGLVASACCRPLGGLALMRHSPDPRSECTRADSDLS